MKCNEHTELQHMQNFTLSIFVGGINFGRKNCLPELGVYQVLRILISVKKFWFLETSPDIPDKTHDFSHKKKVFEEDENDTVNSSHWSIKIYFMLNKRKNMRKIYFTIFSVNKSITFNSLPDQWSWVKCSYTGSSRIKAHRKNTSDEYVEQFLHFKKGTTVFTQ